MKKILLVGATLLASVIAAEAATIAIKNDTGKTQRLTVLQGGQIKAYVTNLKSKNTLLVKVDDAGPKALIILNDEAWIYVRPKTYAFKLTWLMDFMSR